MYRIIKAVSNDGEDKLDRIASIHSLEGEFYDDRLPEIGERFFFVYDDDSEKMMASSIVYNVINVGEQLRVETKNSEYWFEKVEE